MTFYMVAWITWQCGLVPMPPRLRPMLCQETVEQQAHTTRMAADRAVDALGPAARPRLWRYDGLRRTELPVAYSDGARR